MSVDFARIFDAVPGCHLLLAPDFTIVGVSGGYLRATMTTPEIVGQNLFDVFPDNPEDPAADGVRNLKASLQRVLAERRTDAMPVQKYDIRRPESEGGGFEERFWSAVNIPVRGADGQVATIIHSVEDVTEVAGLRARGRDQDRVLRELTRRSEERYAALLDTAPDAMVVVDESGRIVLVNVQTERLFGYTRAELLGQPLEILVPERARGVHRQHLARFFGRPDARPMGTGLELFARRKDGTELPIEVSLSPLQGESKMTVSAAIRDITERKRLEAETQLLAQRLSSAVESMEDGFALFDDEDRLVLCNSVYRRLLDGRIEGPVVGRTREELREALIPDLVFSDAQALSAFRASLSGTDRATTFQLRTRDGRSLRAMTRPTPEGGTLATVWDTTDDERDAEELREARTLAEAGSAAKSEFLSSMSHELRTPLNAILGFAQLLQRDKKTPLSERHRERVDQILKGGEHLLRLIDDILDLSRIEAGAISMSLEAVSVREVLDEVRRTLEPIASRQHIALAVGVPDEIPMVTADRTRLVQILMNFGSNAIKYNRPDGRVSFDVRASSADAIRLSVRDTGMGIPADKQAKLFQPFQRAGQETGPIEGTGIGLVITKRLAELMHGGVGFESSGDGSTFWVELPVHHEAASFARLSVSRAPRTPRSGATTQHLVLYVEDNPANVAFMEDFASSFDGVDLVTVPTAELGVELARARRPSVILMDINLPGMSGLDALKALRVLPETKDIPVIALTAAASERDRHRGTTAGFFRYLTKPVNVDELVEAMDLVLAGSPPSH